MPSIFFMDHFTVWYYLQKSTNSILWSLLFPLHRAALVTAPFFFRAIHINSPFPIQLNVFLIVYSSFIFLKVLTNAFLYIRDYRTQKLALLKKIGLWWERLQENRQSWKQNKRKLARRTAIKISFRTPVQIGYDMINMNGEPLQMGNVISPLPSMPSHPSTILSRIMKSWCWPQSISVLPPWARQVNQN